LPIFLVGLIEGIPSSLLSSLAQSLEKDQPGPAGLVRLLSSAVQLLISAYLSGGMTTFLFKVARGQPYSLSDVFSGGRYFGTMLLALFLIQVGTTIGFLLCIVPGVILALGWSLAVPLIVDKNLPAIDALKESWRMTNGHKGNLFVFALLS